MNRIRIISLFALMLCVLNQAPAQPVSAGNPDSVKNKLAVQLWSFREDFKRDVPGTLKRVRQLGFTNVELAGYYGLTAEQFRAQLDKAGLKAVSMHIELEAARDQIDRVIREAKIFGVQFVGVPWINSPFTKADCLAAIKVFNQAGQKLAANGIGFFYHLHGYEFIPNEGGKGTLFDLMMAQTNPRFVSFQLDTYHAAFPGQDPVKLMQKYPGRFTSLHLKDIREGFVGDNSGDYREVEARPMGQGKINWPGLFKAARKQKLGWYIVEDETTDVWKNVAASLEYLEKIKD